MTDSSAVDALSTTAARITALALLCVVAAGCGDTQKAFEASRTEQCRYALSLARSRADSIVMNAMHPTQSANWDCSTWLARAPSRGTQLGGAR